jgi:hypothetical protein
MTYYIVKIAVSAALVVAISEFAKRSTTAGALLASLPVVSVLAFIWIYLESGDGGRVAQMSSEIFWLVLPSLALFLALPWLLRHGLPFWPALGVACLTTAALYGGALFVAGQLGRID